MNFKCALLSVLVTTSVFAGRETGNGGFAHVCRDADKKITSAQLLDLWEGEALNTWATNEPMDKQIKIALEKIKDIVPDAENVIQAVLPEIRKNFVFSKRPLSKTDDAFPPYEAGEGCAYEQVARFESVLTETGKRGLRIFTEIYNSPFFSESDKAALMLHEAIYLLDRSRNDARTSTRTRTLVAHLFSESTVPNAVRMTFATLPITLEDTMVWATADRQNFQFNFTLNSVDGANRGSDVTTEQKEYLYRCTAGEPFSDEGQGDSGWLSLEELLDLDVSPGGFTSPISLKGSISGSGTPFEPGQAFADSIRFACSKKTAEGIESPVKLAGYYYSDTAECLSISSDGSVATFTGDDCLTWVKDEKADGMGNFSHVEIVKANPETK